MGKRDREPSGWYCQRTWLRDQTTNIMDLTDAAYNLAAHGVRLHQGEDQNLERIKMALAAGFVLGTRRAWFQLLGAAGVG